MEHKIGDIYREKIKAGRYKYFLKKTCPTCNKEYYTGKYNPTDYCSSKCKGSSTGRPIGTKLTKRTKKKISKGRTSNYHSSPTKDKISNSIHESVLSGLVDRSNNGSPPGEDHPHFKHGHNSDNSSIYRKWRVIKNRCHNINSKDYKYYGSRGITMCDDWRNNFLFFFDWCNNNGYEPGLHLHRVNPDMGYSPDNTTFLTPSEHSRLHWRLRNL